MTADAPALTALLDELDRLHADVDRMLGRAGPDSRLLSEHRATGRLLAAVRAALALADRWQAHPLADAPLYAPEDFADRLRTAITAALEEKP